MRQGHKTESRDGGRAEGPARESESSRAQRNQPGAHDSGRAEGPGPRDSGKGQTVGQGRSDHDNAQRSQESSKGSQESSKERREMGADRAYQKSQKDQKDQKGETVGQGRSDRDEMHRSEDRTPDKSKADNQRIQQQSRENQNRSGMQGQSAQDRNSSSGQNVTQGQAATNGQTQTHTNLTAQQQTKLQQSVLHADNAPRVNESSINFQVHSGVAVPSSISAVSVSTYPALIDMFPAYRDDSFFVVEDEIVFLDHDRRIVDVVPAGPRTRFSGGGHGSSGSVAAIDLRPDDIRVVQRVLIERGLLHGEADGILGPETREAITTFQRQQGIQATGSIDARTVSSLGVSAQLSQQANESLGQSQTTTGQGQAGIGQSQMGRPRSNQQNATGQAPNQTTGQAASPPAQQNQPTTTGQSTTPNQSNTTGQAAPHTQSGNKPMENQNAPSGQHQGTSSAPTQPSQSSTPGR
jgi:peptidoglycan hydrolase-like protein with peptidoglycan-binding domain